MGLKYKKNNKKIKVWDETMTRDKAQPDRAMPVMYVRYKCYRSALPQLMQRKGIACKDQGVLFFSFFSCLRFSLFGSVHWAGFGGLAHSVC